MTFQIKIIALILTLFVQFKAMAQLKAELRVVNPQFNLIDNEVIFDLEVKSDVDLPIGIYIFTLRGYVSNAQFSNIEVFDNNNNLINNFISGTYGTADIFGLPGDYTYFVGGINDAIFNTSVWNKIASIKGTTAISLNSGFCGSVILDENFDGSSFTNNNSILVSLNGDPDSDVEVQHYNWAEFTDTSNTQLGYTKGICADPCGYNNAALGDCYESVLRPFCGLPGSQSFNDANIILDNSNMQFSTFNNFGDLIGIPLDIDLISNRHTGNALALNFGHFSAPDTIVEFETIFSFNPPISNFAGYIYDIDHLDSLSIEGTLNGIPQTISFTELGNCITQVNSSSVKSNCQFNDLDGDNNAKDGLFKFNFSGDIDNLSILYKSENQDLNFDNDYSFLPEYLPINYNSIDTLNISTGFNHLAGTVYVIDSTAKSASDLNWTITDAPTSLNLDLPMHALAIFPEDSLNWNISNIYASGYISPFKESSQYFESPTEAIVYQTCFGILSDNSSITIDIDVLVDETLELELLDFSQSSYIDSLTTITNNVSNLVPSNFNEILILDKGIYCLKANHYNSQGTMALNINGKIYGENILDHNCFGQPFECFQDLFLDGIVPAYEYTSGNTITSSGNIVNNANVVFFAENSILLDENFSIPADANFNAELLQYCDPNIISIQDYCSLPAPTELYISATYADSLLLTWDPISGVDSFELYYQSDSSLVNYYYTNDTFLYVPLNNMATHHLFIINSYCADAVNNSIGATVTYNNDVVFDPNCVAPLNLTVNLVDDSLSIEFNAASATSTFNIVIDADGNNILNLDSSINNIIFDTNLLPIGPDVLVLKVTIKNVTGCLSSAVVKNVDGIYGIEDLPNGIENINNVDLINICKNRHENNIVFSTFQNQLGNVVLNRFTCSHVSPKIFYNQHEYIDCHCDDLFNQPLPVIKCNE